ncbi:MAG: glycosyltransferase family 4 protein [Verrucomicrobiota bacterium]|nr:glycosyltransferase family 4 protein [Verrucomicrobiota bacterium]
MQAKLRFLMLNWRDPENPAAGGAERVSLGYLAALTERGHDVWWFSNAYPGCTRTSSLKGVHIVRAGRTGTAVLAAFRWYQSQAPFDLVIDQHHGIPWFAPWWSQTRCVAYIHEVLGPIWSSFYDWPLDQVGRFQERWIQWLYRRTPFWTACKETETMLRRHGIQYIQRIPYGVSTQCLSPLPPKPLTAPVRLIVVSRLAPNKRIEHTIQTVECLRKRGIDARLTIVGDGEEKNRLVRYTRERALDRLVTFRGTLNEIDKDEALAASHLLLHTSIREGWGLNVIEANAMGTPSVVYPVAGLTESTLHDVTGRVAQKETPEAVANEIHYLMEYPDTYTRYRLEAWRRAKDYHWDAILPSACNWLESMATGKGQPA